MTSTPVDASPWTVQHAACTLRAVSSAKIAIVGDYRPQNETHRAVTDGLTAAGAEIEWVRSDGVDTAAERLAAYGGVVAAPGSPYASMDGVLAATRHARERGVPFTGT